MKPRLFIGSSSESLGLAYAVHENLKRDAECTPWNEGVFEPSKYTLESIVQVLSTSDFGLFVFAGDDILRMRSVDYAAVRDNVLFELGMFVGRLGRDRTFFLLPEDQRNFRLPTDLLGLTPLIFESDRQDQNWTAAVGPACHQVRLAMKRLAAVTVSTPVPSKNSLEEEVLVALKLHKFADQDMELQKTRIELAGAIAKVAANGLSLADAETVWALGNTNYNYALRYKASPDLVPLHIEEADAFNRFLSEKILSAQKDEGKAKAIHYLGVHHHNMVSMLTHTARNSARRAEA